MLDVDQEQQQHPFNPTCILTMLILFFLLSRQPILDVGRHGDDLGAADPHWP